MKNVIVCCHAAMASSSVIEACLKQFLEKNNIEATVRKAMTLEMDSILATEKVDLIVPNGVYRTDKCPVVSGMPYLTGMGVEKMEAKMLDILTKEEE